MKLKGLNRKGVIGLAGLAIILCSLGLMFGAQAALKPHYLPKVSALITKAYGQQVALVVELAKTEAEMEQGLMGRTELAEDSGMLFWFERDNKAAFWMKDTTLPLSIAFIDSEGRIIDLRDMQPFDETSVGASSPYRYALEMKQGWFDQKGIKVGDKLMFLEASKE